jgi:hypothetical protein
MVINPRNVFDWFHALKNIMNMEYLDQEKEEGLLPSVNGEGSHNVAGIPSHRFTTPFYRFLNTLPPRPMNRGLLIAMQGEESFDEVYPKLMDSFYNSHVSGIGFAFRFIPFNPRFIVSEIGYTSTQLERLTEMCNSLGLFYRSCSLSTGALFSYTSLGAGLRGLVRAYDDDYPVKILLDAVATGTGYYGPFLALVAMGIGCTVWYSVDPCPVGCMPDPGVYGPLLGGYEPFFDFDYRPPGFKIVRFLETFDVTHIVDKSMRRKPLSEINIPEDDGDIRSSVGLGTMIVFSMAVGLAPGVSGWK